MTDYGHPWLDHESNMDPIEPRRLCRSCNLEMPATLICDQCADGTTHRSQERGTSS